MNQLFHFLKIWIEHKRISISKSTSRWSHHPFLFTTRKPICRFGIASVTLEGGHEEGRRGRDSNLLQVARVLEGVCRSLNNLLEKFHQSFFFYLLSATNRYISIGMLLVNQVIWLSLLKLSWLISVVQRKGYNINGEFFLGTVTHKSRTLIDTR